MRGLHSSLDVADSFASLIEPDYSLSVGRRLTAAYAAVKAKKFAAARGHLACCDDRKMSARQRMRVLYLWAMALIPQSDLSRALACLDDALDQAVLLRDLGACAQLAYFHAAIDYETTRISQAAEYYAIALTALRDLGARDGGYAPADPDFEREVLVGCASDTFLLAQFQQAQAHVADAQRLAALTAASELQVAPLEWLLALLDRWRGELGSALQHATRACAAYAQAGARGSHERAQIVVADIALDLAESFGAESGTPERDAYLGVAAPYAQRAVRAAQDLQDSSGEGMAWLAVARWQRVRGAGGGLPLIEGVLRQARGQGDVLLLGQAYTALGHELATRGVPGTALDCHRAALNVLNGHDAHAMAVWPRRALLRASEMS